MIIRHPNDNTHHSQLYAVLKTPGTDNKDKILWAEYDDDSKGDDVECPPFENDQLIHYGFRRWYCKAESSDLRTGLGKPITGEIGTWAQFQDRTKGLLIYGIPGVDVAKERVVNGVFATAAFLQLVGVFLDKAEPREATGFRPGRKIQVSLHDALPRNVYCTALWYPANTTKYISEDLFHRPDCGDAPVDGKTYINPRRESCNIFGFK
jgi:hypothetical protein